ncbi:hypothetical protein K8353_30985 [Burkholderia contaminans]|nr:hypothetical protein [Burkholderia contaminans]
MFEGLGRAMDAAFLQLMERSGVEAKIVTRVEAALSARLQTMVEAEVRKTSNKEEGDKSEEAKIRKGKWYVALLGLLSISLAVGGGFIYFALPDTTKPGIPARVQEAVGYLAYLFPLYAVLIAGRGLIVTDKKVNAEEQARSAFLQSLVFVMTGVVAQIGYQLRESGPWLLRAIGLIIVLLAIALLLQSVNAMTGRRRATAKPILATEFSFGVIAMTVAAWSIIQLSTLEVPAEKPEDITEASRWYNYKFDVEPAPLGGVAAIAGYGNLTRPAENAHGAHRK